MQFEIPSSICLLIIGVIGRLKPALFGLEQETAGRNTFHLRLAPKPLDHNWVLSLFSCKSTNVSTKASVAAFPLQFVRR